MQKPARPLLPSGDPKEQISLKEKSLLQMPRRHCTSCRIALHDDDGHSECISCLGKPHADAALSEMDCSHCVNMSLATLRARIAFFLESEPSPRALLFSSFAASEAHNRAYMLIVLPKRSSGEWRLPQNDSLKQKEAEQNSILVRELFRVEVST